MAANQQTASLSLIESLTVERDLLRNEVNDLREREQRYITELHEARQCLNDPRHEWLRVVAELIEGAPDGVVVTTLDGVITYVNRAFQDMTGHEESMVGMQLNDLIAPEERRFVPVVVQRLIQTGSWQGTRTYIRRDGSTFEANISLVLIRDEHRQPYLRAAIIRDLARQRRLEQEQLLLQEQVIADQQNRLRGLSVPVLRLTNWVVLAPVSGSIDNARADEIVDAILASLAWQPAETVIVDISGQAEISQPVARLVLRASQALRLVNTRLVITGMQPAMAGTLAVLGIDQAGILFYPTLQTAISTVL